MVGRLDKDKGIGAMTQLLSKLAEAEQGHLIVCGSGIAETHLHRVARDLGVGDRVTFTGFLPAAELSSVYRLASALLVLGRNEVQPLAVLEAFASGLPIVSLRSRNLEATLDDGVTGFFAESVSEAYELGLRLFEDDALRSRLGRSARRTAEARFSLAAAAGEFLDCYRSLTDPEEDSVSSSLLRSRRQELRAEVAGRLSRAWSDAKRTSLRRPASGPTLR